MRAGRCSLFRASFGVRTRPRVAFVSPLSLQPDWMSGIKPARWPINGLPTRRPSAGVMIERCCVESQSGYDSERVTFARVNGDPSTRAAFAIAAELG